MRGIPATIALLVTAATPAAADLTADDIWQGWDVALTQVGATRTGEIERDGSVVTLHRPGVAFDLPQGWGTIEWQAETLVLNENTDGSVSLSFPRGLPLSLSVTTNLPLRSRTVNISAELTAEELGWRYSGVPDDMQGTFTAQRLTLEMLRPRVTNIADWMGGEADDPPTILTSGFIVAEDVERRSRIALGTDMTLSGDTNIGHLVSTFSGEDDAGIWHRGADTRDLAGDFSLRLPKSPLARPAITAALRESARLQVHGTIGTYHARMTRHEEGEIRRDEQQIVHTTNWALGLSRNRGLDLALGNRGVESTTDGAPDLTADSGRLRVRLPLIARRQVQEVLLEAGLDDLVLQGRWRERAGMSGATPEPVNLDLAMRGDVIVTDDLAIADWLLDDSLSIEPLRAELDEFDLSWGDSALSGTGHLAWPQGTELGQLSQAEGELTVAARGIYAWTEQVARAELLPPAMLMTLRMGLAFLARPVGEDQLEAQIEFGAGGLRINGMTLPF